MSVIECPDCDGTWEVHAEGCPIWQVIDKQQRDDRAFFDKYPDVEVRRRKPIVGELMTAAVGAGFEIPELPEGRRWHAGGYVLVCRTYSPDIRVRRFENAYLVVDPDAPVTHRVELKPVAPNKVAVLPEQWAKALFGESA